jgi:hypothetical protein
VGSESSQARRLLLTSSSDSTAGLPDEVCLIDITEHGIENEKVYVGAVKDV